MGKNVKYVDGKCDELKLFITNHLKGQSTYVKIITNGDSLSIIIYS